MHRALVIDDDKPLQLLFLTLLTRSGFVVDCVPNGVRALENLHHHSYCTVILDLIMPATDGFQVVDELRRTRPELIPRVLVVTAATGRELLQLDQTGLRAVLRKPVDIADLIEHALACCPNAAHRTSA